MLDYLQYSQVESGILSILFTTSIDIPEHSNRTEQRKRFKWISDSGFLHKLIEIGLTEPVCRFLGILLTEAKDNGNVSVLLKEIEDNEELVKKILRITENHLSENQTHSLDVLSKLLHFTCYFNVPGCLYFPVQDSESNHANCSLRILNLNLVKYIKPSLDIFCSYFTRASQKGICKEVIITLDVITELLKETENDFILFESTDPKFFQTACHLYFSNL